MRDIITKGLQQAAEALERNSDKIAHIQDVVRRLEAASYQYPHDLVIRHMEDIFRKKASNSPHHLVTADEFNGIKQNLWGFNPKTAINEIFPDLFPQ